MKKLYIPILVLCLLFALMLTACDNSYDAAYDANDEMYDDGGANDNDGHDDDSQDDAEDIVDDTIRDDDGYTKDESASFSDEDFPLTAEDCFDDEIYDPETQTCIFECEDDPECDLILAELYDDEPYLADYEFYAMSEEDCLPGESYDPNEQMCYIECDTDAECDELAAEIYADLDVYFNDSYNGRSDSPVPQENTTSDAIPNDLSGGDEELPTIARYTLDSNLDLQLAGLDDSQPDSRINQDRHQEIWDFLRRVLPPTLLKSDVSEYHIFTDGVDETLAYVSPLASDPNQWLIGIDIADAGASGKINTRDFVHTTIHEFAHILTLENDQVPPDTSLSAAEIAAGEESDVARACTTFYTGEGCALSNSYINQFFTKFWADLYYNEFQDVEWAETDEEYEEKMIAFYDTYSDQFVTEYAATNPGEDIAESFAYFVLQDKPTGSSIADQKVRFFYDYPALVTIRNHMRSELARMQ